MRPRPANSNSIGPEDFVPDSDFRIAGFTVQPRLNRIVRDEQSISLEPRVIEVLACLAERPGSVRSKHDIIRRVWQDTFVTDDVLIRAISLLRKAFGDDIKNPAIIRTIPRRGYQLVGSVERSETGERRGLLLPGRPSTSRFLWNRPGKDQPDTAGLKIPDRGNGNRACECPIHRCKHHT